MRPARKLSRKRFPVWLRELIDSGEAEGLEWLDPEKGTFRIPWTRVDSPEFDVAKDANVFQKWAEFTGRFKKGERTDPSVWKTRFRCAIRKMTELKEVQVPNSLEEKGGNRPYRVFRFKEAGEKNDRAVKRNMRLHSSSVAPSSMRIQPSFPSRALYPNYQNNDGQGFRDLTTQGMTSQYTAPNNMTPQNMTSHGMTSQNLRNAADEGFLYNSVPGSAIYGHAEMAENPCYDSALPVGGGLGDYDAYASYYSKYGYIVDDSNNIPYYSQYNSLSDLSSTGQWVDYNNVGQHNTSGQSSETSPVSENQISDRNQSQCTASPSLPRISVHDVERILQASGEDYSSQDGNYTDILQSNDADHENTIGRDGRMPEVATDRCGWVVSESSTCDHNIATGLDDDRAETYTELL